MDESDRAVIRAYAFKIDERLSNSAFAKLPFVFPSADVESLAQTKSQVHFLSGFQPA